MGRWFCTSTNDLKCRHISSNTSIQEKKKKSREQQQQEKRKKRIEMSFSQCIKKTFFSCLKLCSLSRLVDQVRLFNTSSSGRVGLLFSSVTLGWFRMAGKHLIVRGTRLLYRRVCFLEYFSSSCYRPDALSCWQGICTFGAKQQQQFLEASSQQKSAN